MRNAGSELVWQGRLQLGDEPGVFGDAAYAGLACELPVTLSKESNGAAAARVVIHTEGVRTFAPYVGHIATVVLYEDGAATVIGSGRIANSSEDDAKIVTELAVDLSSVGQTAFVGVRVHVDTEVPPGLYDDFVVTGLYLQSSDGKVFGSLGFHL